MVVDKDGKVLSVAAPNNMVERSADVRVDEVASALAAPLEMAAVRCELSIGNGPLGLKAGGATGDAAGHIRRSVGETVKFLGAEGQATEYGSGKFILRERREMLKGVRITEGTQDVDARFADIGLVGDCSVDEVKPVRRFAERDSARDGKLVCSGEDNALSVRVDLDGGAVAD